MTPTSLLPESVETIISGFAANVVPTAMDILVIIVPVGLALWAIGFGVGRGLGFLKNAAGQAIRG